jgi:hypothetical protein
MSSDAPTNLPRKKRSILWPIAAVFLLLLGVFLLQLFGPDPPIVVSSQTTYITEPLGSNGLPDYERYLLGLYRDGVTPQNNAAALLWKTLWPGELQPAEYAAVAKELGLAQIPSKQDSLAPLHDVANRKRVADWLEQQAAAANVNRLDGDDSQQTAQEAAEEVLGQAISRPWTSEQIPPLAEWVRTNQRPLDTLVEASHRPRCYFPSSSLLDAERGSLISMLLPGQQGARVAGRALSARAMWHLGEERPDEAWQDLLAAHRIGRLLAQGHTLIEQLIGIAIDGIACEGTQTLVHHGNLSTEQLQQIRRDLAELPPFTRMAQAVDQTERLATIDGIMHLCTANNENWEEVMAIMNNDAGGLPLLNMVSLDWNLVLRDVNQWYDRLTNAAQLSNRQDRQAAFDRVDADMQRLIAESQRPAKLALSTISRHQRSQVVSAMMIGLFLPAISAATDAEDRANAAMHLTQLAAALAAYRAAHGAYPEKLDELVPTVLDKMPADIHTASPLIYRRDGEGYLLYSAGDNGKDDGGSNERTSTLAGQSLSDLNDAEAQTLQTEIPAGSDDIGIRLPHRSLELPHVLSRGAPAPDK